MANEILPITELAKAGLVIDTPPVALAQNAFTDVQNVRFKDNAVNKITGEILLNNIVSDLTGTGEEFGKVRYLAYWPNPNLTPLGGYYLFVVDYVVNDVTVGQKVYIQDHLGTKRDLTPTSLNSGNGFAYTTSGWQHTLFSGGFSLIINNGIDKPHYILDNEGNTDINDLVLAELPGWDSYNGAFEIHNDTFSTGMDTIFDLGQIVDFTVAKIVITGTNIKTVKTGSPAGTGTPNDTNFVPGALPTTTPVVTGNQFEIYTDSTTNTTVVVIGGLTDGDEVIVTIETRNAVTVRASVVRAFGDLLVAGDLTEVDSVDSTKIIRRLSGVVRTSDLALPGTIPNNWNPFAAGVSTADEFTISETNIIKDLRSLQGNMYIYTSNSIHVMTLTGLDTAPVSFAPITDSYGVNATNIITEYDGKHFVVGSNDIYIFAGHPADIQSVSDARIRKYFFDNLNPIHEQQAFSLLNKAQDEIWLCYPTLNSFAGECDEALIWNYRNNVWSKRELNDVMAGDIAPIKGGGVPSVTFAITGNTGNAGYTNTGLRETQTIDLTGYETTKAHLGATSEFTATVPYRSSFYTDMTERVSYTATIDSGPNLEYAVTILTFPFGTSFTYDADASIYADGGATISLQGDSTIGLVVTNALLLLGNTYNDGDTVTIEQLLTAFVTYINNDNVLADWTASRSGHTLTLTSTNYGEREFTSGTITYEGGTATNVGIALPTAGVGVYPNDETSSPALRMRIQCPEVVGVHSEIDQYFVLDKSLTGTAALANMVTKLRALPEFYDPLATPSVTAIWSVEQSGTDLIFVSKATDNCGTLSITVDTYDTATNTSYAYDKFGATYSGASFSVIRTGVNNNLPPFDYIFTLPDNTTYTTTVDSSVGASGSSYSSSSFGQMIATGVAANSNYTVVTSSTAGPGAPWVVEFESISPFTKVVSPSTSTDPSNVDGAYAPPATFIEDAIGRTAASTTDTITITPPSGYGNAVSVNFDDTTTYPAYDHTATSGAASIEEVTDVEIATAIETAWTDTTHWNISRSGAILTFVSVARTDIAPLELTVTEGNTRAGNGIIAPNFIDDITATETEAGISPEFAELTKVTVYLNIPLPLGVQRTTTKIFEKHYGEGPGRLLDPNFTAADDDNTYGDTAYTNDTDYLNAYYDPDKDLSRTNTTEQAKPNGSVVDVENILLDIIADLSSRASLIVEPDSTTNPTEVEVYSAQYGTQREYIASLDLPFSGTLDSSVAPDVTTLLASAEGTTVATTDPTYDNTGSVINTDLDLNRPWNEADVNPNKIFPIFAQAEVASDDSIENRIRAADIGYTFDGDNYLSYVEKSEMFIMPDFTTEGLDSMALWAGGGEQLPTQTQPLRATLQVRARATNYPGDLPLLTRDEIAGTSSKALNNKLVTNDFVVADDYKVDLRIFGRFLNYRIDDGDSDGDANTNKPWNISGIQLDVSKGGRK